MTVAVNQEQGQRVVAALPPTCTMLMSPIDPPPPDGEMIPCPAVAVWKLVMVLPCGNTMTEMFCASHRRVVESGTFAPWCDECGVAHRGALGTWTPL